MNILFLGAAATIALLTASGLARWRYWAWRAQGAASMRDGLLTALRRARLIALYRRWSERAALAAIVILACTASFIAGAAS